MLKPLAFALLFLATGCVQAPGAYPSLSTRPIELRSDAEPDAPAPVAEADPALDKDIASRLAALDSNNSAFVAGAAKAEAAAKRPGAQSVGSDSWVGAQAAIADIDVLRADTLGMQVDLERFATDRGDTGAAPYPALDAARGKAQDQLDTQTARIAAIKAVLGEK